MFYFHLAQAQHLAGNRTAAATALRRAAELGLTPADVSSLEQQAYRQLAAALEK
jgi:hypothetical protein